MHAPQWRSVVMFAVLAVSGGLALAQTNPASQPSAVVGWRGNWLGSFPHANPPITWERRSKSPANDLSCSAQKPKSDNNAGAVEVSEGFIGQWLVLGPFRAADAAKALDEQFIADEAKASPAEGDKVRELAWKLETMESFEATSRKPAMRDAPWNTAKADFLDFGKLMDRAAGQVAYAHVYLYSPRDGAVTLLLTHTGGLKIWVNGAVAYTSAKDGLAWGYNYWAMNNLITGNPPAPQAKLELKKGWNRVLFKLASAKDNWYFDTRVGAPADAGYESKNILWECKLPLWSRGLPVVCGDRVFVMSEPDELICINRKDGKILWRRTNTLFDTLTAQERQANPLYKDVEAVVAKMTQAQGYEEIFTLRRQMRDILYKIDEKRFMWSKPGHYPAHGFTTPTPVCDGQFVYVYLGLGVAACYDLEGNRKWTVRVDDIGHDGDFNNQSPALVGDKFILWRGGHFRALDKNTGKTLWTSDLHSFGVDIYHGDKKSPSVNWAGSVIPAKIGDVDVVLGPIKGKVCRVSDGKMVSLAMGYQTNTSCAAAGGYIFDGSLVRYKLKAVSADEIILDQRSGSGGGDFASPLYHDGLVYTLSSHGAVSVFESAEKDVRPLYTQQLPMKPFFHFDGPGCTASPMLCGKYVYLCDSKGTTVVIESGRTFKQVVVNRIDHFALRVGVGNPQEDTYSTPVCDGDRIYIRGEENLYCIGQK